jgi:hypothetical protein
MIRWNVKIHVIADRVSDDNNGNHATDENKEKNTAKTIGATSTRFTSIELGIVGITSPVFTFVGGKAARHRTEAFRN